MILVDMDNVQFYQPSKAAGICKDGQPAVSSLRFFMALGPSEKREKTLLNLNRIKNFDMTDLPLFDTTEGTILLIV